MGKVRSTVDTPSTKVTAMRFRRRRRSVRRRGGFGRRRSFSRRRSSRGRTRRLRIGYRF